MIETFVMLLLEVRFKGKDSVFMKYNPFNEDNKLPKGLCLLLLLLAVVCSCVKVVMLLINK